jgi:hypothetical protein
MLPQVVLVVVCCSPSFVIEYPLLQMVTSWRREFSAGLTDPQFPFGVISMHAWCGEEESNCSPGYPNGIPGYDNPMHTATQYTAQMRWYGEQAGQPTVPNPSLPGVYLAMTYDIGDPQWCYATSPYGTSRFYTSFYSILVVFPSVFTNRKDVAVKSSSRSRPLYNLLTVSPNRQLQQRRTRAG